MNTKLKQKLFIMLISFILIFILESVLDVIIFKRFYARYFILEFGMMFILLSPILLFSSNKYSIIYASIIFVATVALVTVNLILEFGCGDIFSIKYIFLAGEAGKVTSMQYVNFWYIIVALCFVLIFGISIYFMFGRTSYKEPKKWNIEFLYYPVGIAYMLIFIVIGLTFENVGFNQVKNHYDQYEVYEGEDGFQIVALSSEITKRTSMEYYGLYTFTYAEFYGLLSNVDNSDQTKIKEYLNSGTPLEEDTTNPTSEFYNSMSGMNVLEIMIETGTNLAVNETLTPNLYKLMNDGISFKNNYSKNKTNVSELIGILGNMSESVIPEGYSTGYTLPAILRNKGYYTTYLHNNSKNFYKRDGIMTSLGFENKVFQEDLDPDEEVDFISANYPLDTEMLYKYGGDKAIIPSSDTTSNRLFYSFWTSFSTHGPWNTSERNMGYLKDSSYNIYFDKENNEEYGTPRRGNANEKSYYQELKEAEEKGLYTNPCLDDSKEIQDQFENYQLLMMNFDDALGILLSRLEKLGILDNTLIVIYGDHEPYYRSNGFDQLKLYVYGKNGQTVDSTYSPQYQTYLTIYNKKLRSIYDKVTNTNNGEYNYFSSPYVIVPTVLDLLGINYNTNYFVSKSAFRINDDNAIENTFYSHEQKVFITDKLYATNYETYLYEADDITEEYIESFKNESSNLMNKIQIFNRLYSSQKFSILNNIKTNYGVGIIYN